MTRHPYHRLTSPRRVGAIRRLQELVERISDDTTYNVAESSVLSWLSTATGYTLTAVADIATYMKPSEARVQYAALITAAMVGAISPLGNYAANDVVPATVLDFENDVYAGTVSAFSDLSFAATSNATVIDSDGVLKWRAHCLNTYSSDMTHADWTGTSGATKAASSETSPYSGATPAQFISSGVAGSGVRNTYSALPAGVSVAGTIAFKIGTAGFGYVQINGTTGGTTTASAVHVNLSTGAVGSVIALANGGLSNAEASVVDAGDGWYELKLSGGIGTGNTKAEIYGGPSDDATSRQTTSGKYVNVSGGRITRSGLGGMQNNPLTGDSYVPTTTAAVYLPRFDYATGFRRLLIEPTASTNAYLSSGEITSGDWTNTNLTVTPDAAVSPTGETDATKLEATATASTELRQDRSLTDKATVSVWWKQGPSGSDYGTRLQLRDQSLGVTLVTATFDPSTETFSYITGSSGGTFYAYPNGWYRIALSVTFSGTKLIRASLFNNGANSDAGDDCYVYGPQLEPTTEVTSYIPTAGSSATRAAETLAIPAAKIADYQTPTYIGSELVTNGTDPAEWTASDAQSLVTDVGGSLQLENGDDSQASMYRGFATEVGKVYEFTFDLTSEDGNTVLRLGTAASGNQIYADNSFVAPTVVKVVFVASSTTTYATVYTGSVTTGHAALIGAVSAREINPLAVGFAMSGEMTYADNNLGAELTYFRWYNGSTSRIEAQLQTSLGTGRVVAYHAKPGTTTVGLGTANFSIYSPGISTPFSIGLRVTSTEFALAVEGTQQSINTALTGLFDGSATNIQLAQLGGPMRIAKFIMWNEDTGQTGIEEASA